MRILWQIDGHSPKIFDRQSQASVNKTITKLSEALQQYGNDKTHVRIVVRDDQ